MTRMRRKIVLLIALILTSSFIVTIESRVRRRFKEPECSKTPKMTTPDFLETYGNVKWLRCCDPDFNVETNVAANYVWPMEAIEKVYFFITGCIVVYIFDYVFPTCLAHAL